MATTVPEIQVFATFHTDPGPSSWIWVHRLTFPVDTLRNLQFTQKPYKWIRYATGVVVGAQGDLSFSPDSPHDMDYNRDFPSKSTDLFYHTTDAERENMFPADPDMDRTNVTSSEVTTQRAQFRRDVVGRDQECVLTAFLARNCDAAHLLPHSKGNDYIETYTQHRSRHPDGNDIVREIDSVRNGILLHPVAHRNFGTNIAFLVTPNFAMSTADVDPDAPPTKRCTAHLFDPDEPESFGDHTLPSGSPVRMPDTADEWPPDILFDAIYANAVLRHFAPQTMRDTLKRWKSTFYPRGMTGAAQASHQAIIDQRAAESERREEQKHAHEQRAARRENGATDAGDDRDDYFDYLMIMPYIMIPPDKLEVVWRKAAEKRAERKRSHLEDKVVGWRRKVEDASP